jgi:hypothetical protein
MLMSSLVFTSGSSLALVLKKKGNVNYSPFSTKDSISQLTISKSLFNQDLILTGKDGFTKVVYLDDGSAIKVHRNSEVYIQGAVKNRKISKKINIAFGKMKLDVNPQKNESFLISTPNSVATVKGTRFWVKSTPEFDLFLGLEGQVEITNSETGSSIVLDENFTVSSSYDGELTIAPTLPLELQALENLEAEMGELTEEEIDSGINIPPAQVQSTVQNLGPQEHQLRIKLLNSLGEEKVLIIDYVE